MPEHGDVATCKHCGGEVSYYVYSDSIMDGEYIVHDAWWAHRNHPADHHDAEVA